LIFLGVLWFSLFSFGFLCFLLFFLVFYVFQALLRPKRGQNTMDSGQNSGQNVGWVAKMLDGWLKWWPKLIFSCVAKIIFVSKMRRYFGHFRVQNHFGHFRVQNKSHFGHACPKLAKIGQNAWPKLTRVAKMRNSGQNATMVKIKNAQKQMENQ